MAEKDFERNDDTNIHLEGLISLLNAGWLNKYRNRIIVKAWYNLQKAL